MTKLFRCTERVSGTASLTPVLEGEYTLQACLLPRVEISCRKSENGVEAEGVLLAEVLVKGTDGAYRSTSLSLPFAFPVDLEGESVEAEGLACGLNVRRKKNGEIEAEATLKLSFRAYKGSEFSYVKQVEEGEAYEEETSGFSVFLTVAGEELWTVAKRLRCDPETLQKNNPNMEFPLQSGQKIFVYRQIP